MRTFLHFELICSLCCFAITVSDAQTKSILKRTGEQEKSKPSISFNPYVAVGVIPAKEDAGEIAPIVSILDTDVATLKPPAVHRPRKLGLGKRYFTSSENGPLIQFYVREEVYPGGDIQANVQPNFAGEYPQLPVFSQNAISGHNGPTVIRAEHYFQGEQRKLKQTYLVNSERYNGEQSEYAPKSEPLTSMYKDYKEAEDVEQPLYRGTFSVSQQVLIDGR